MFISVVICTYVRAKALTDLLACLQAQTYLDFEVLIVDGSEKDGSVREAVAAFQKQPNPLNLRLIQSEKGLTRQRNEGIRAARGDLLCFLDDDLTVEDNFLAQVATLFEHPDLLGTGGMTAFDLRNYPTPITLRWRLRRWLRIVPDLRPGAIDRLGRAVPVSFLQPFSGLRDIGYLPGFCMIYRRLALSSAWFDEELPTYGGEDRDFSFRVGKRWRLVICGDLHVRHHYAPQSRPSDVSRVYQDGFGSGRVFAKHARRWDRLELVRFLICDFGVSALAVLQNPSAIRARSAFARTAGIIAGVQSWSPFTPFPAQPSAAEEPEA